MTRVRALSLHTLDKRVSIYFSYFSLKVWATLWQNQQNVPSLIWVFAICMKNAWVLYSYPLSAQQSLRSYCADAQAHLSLCQLDALSDWRPEGRGFSPRRGRQHSFVEIDHEIFSTVILSLPLIQEGQLSISGERMCTILVNRLED